MKYFVLIILFFLSPSIYGQLLIGNQWMHKNVGVRGGAYGYTTYIEDAIILKYNFPKRTENSYSYSLKSELSFNTYRTSKGKSVLISQYPFLFQLNSDGLNADFFSFTLEGGYVLSSISTGREYEITGISHGYTAGFSFNFKLQNKLTAYLGYRRLLDLKSTLVDPHLFAESNFFIGIETDIIDLFKDLTRRSKKKKKKK